MTYQINLQNNIIKNYNTRGMWAPHDEDTLNSPFDMYGHVDFFFKDDKSHHISTFIYLFIYLYFLLF